MTDSVTHLVEYSCRHRDVVTKPLYSEWFGAQQFCEVCQDYRKIVWVEPDD